MRLLDGFIGNDDNDNLYNSLGHRCKELSDINLHNYILVLGDNISLGLDKPIQETYPYIVSKYLKMDYYNLSIFNGGVDCLRFNLLSWFKRYNNSPPRFIIIGFEFLNAVLVSNSNYDYLNPADFTQEDVNDLYKYANLSGFFSGRNLLNENLILRNINVPIYQIKFTDKNLLLQNNIFNVEYNGSIFDYSAISNAISKTYQSKNSRIKP